MTTDQQLKAAVKWMWSLGDYAQVAHWLMPYAEQLAAAAHITPGMCVLDVAAGNGNFSVATAHLGANVTASDLTPRMLELGRDRTSAAGLNIVWLEADAEQLPFPSATFDLAASVFGAMFAPDPERVSAELFRVVKPGGLVAMANYADGGFLSQFARLLYRYGPTSSRSYTSPFRWGDAETVRGRFAGLAREVICETRTLAFEFDSADEALASMEASNGPLVALKAMSTPDVMNALRQDARELMAAIGKSVDGRLILESTYLQVIAHKVDERF